MHKRGKLRRGRGGVEVKMNNAKENNKKYKTERKEARKKSIFRFHLKSETLIENLHSLSNTVFPSVRA